MCAKKNSSPSESTTGLLLYLEKCNVCGKQASKKCSGCSLAFYCSSHHQKTDWFRHKPDCYPYSIKPVDGKVGLYLVAERWLTADTIIVGEYPLTIFQDYEFKGDGLSKLLEISKSYLYNCPGCSIGKIPIISQGKVHKCSGCGVPLCSPGCETNPEHCEKECKFIKGIGTRETRTSTEIPSILRDITLLRIMQDEKQRRGKLIPFRNPRWGPLLKLTFCKKFKISEVEMEDITASLVTEKTPEYKQLISSLNVKENFPLSFVAIGKSPDGISSELMVALFHWTLEENSMSLEGNGRRALYDKQPFLSHSCAPNCEAWIDDTRFYNKLIVRVIKPIVPGERLTINMVGPLDPTFLLNPTLERRQKLLRFFPVECSCERCIDPTELGTSLAGIRCQICKDSLTCSYYFPTNPLDNKTSWTCSGAKCRATKTAEQILCITLKAQKELRQIALSGQAESVVTKLQDFVIKHQRRILHPGHYLLLIAKSRISKIISTFLGSGYKLFLCVAAEMPRAYDYCSYKLDFVASHLSFLQKIYQGQNEKTCGKLNYEIGFCEVALLFQDLNQDRIAAQTFYKRLHAALETLNKCREMLMPYSDCVVLMEDVKSFSQMIRKLFGTDFLSTYRLKLLDSMEQSFRNVVKEAIVKWTKACDEISLMKYYINPESHAGAEEKDKMSKKDLQNILMEIPEFN